MKATDGGTLHVIAADRAQKLQRRVIELFRTATESVAALTGELLL